MGIEDHPEDFPRRLRRWRHAACLSQEQAARVFMITVNAYRTWESGRSFPTGPSKAAQRKALNALLDRFEGSRHA